MFSLKIFSLIPFYAQTMMFVGCFEFGDQKMLLTMGTQALCGQKIVKFTHTPTKNFSRVPHMEGHHSKLVPRVPEKACLVPLSEGATYGGKGPHKT